MKIAPLKILERISRPEVYKLMNGLLKKDKTLTELENDYFSAWASYRLMIIEKTILLLEITVLSFSITAFELGKLSNYQSMLTFLMTGAMSLSAINITLFIFHTFCLRDFFISKNIFSPTTLIRDSPLLRETVFNVVFCLFCPNLFLSSPKFSFSTYNSEIDAHFKTSFNDIMTILVIFRFSYFLTLAKNFSFYNNNSSNRICKMIGFKNGFPFLLRTYLRNYSVATIVFISFYLIFFSAYIFRITEYDNPNYTFSNLFHSAWFVMISYSGVSYGDYLIQGTITRFIGIPLIFLGILNTNLIIYTIMNLMTFDSDEKQAFMNYEKRENIDNLTEIRVRLLGRFFRLAVMRKKKQGPFYDLKMRIQVTFFAQMIREYKELRCLVHNPALDLDEGVLSQLDIIDQAILANSERLDDIRKIGQAVEDVLENNNYEIAFKNVNAHSIKEYF